RTRLTTKKRIHDLAKEIGMSGPDLAKKLRDWGFSQIKSHMTALEEFEELQIRGMLGARGLLKETKNESDSGDVSGGLVLKKKKKKRGIEENDSSDTAVEAPPEPDAP